ncbi:hypothetical protein B0H13DRAFT_1919001 [Mycena leptocephala]|nr:hypothetical protein B0H13DRAFT_1919001 [Mycena leptocephala]
MDMQITPVVLAGVVVEGFTNNTSLSGSASHPIRIIQRFTIQVLKVMPRMIRRRSKPSKRRAADDKVPARQDRAFEMAKVACERSLCGGHLGVDGERGGARM